MNRRVLDSELQRGIALRERGDTAAAEALLTGLLPHYPDDPRVLNVLGVMAGEGAAYDRAMHYLSRAAHLQPKDSAILTNLAVVLTQVGKFDAAIETLERSIALTPSLEKAWNSIARALNLSGDPERALDFALPLKGRNPDHLGARMCIVDALSQLGRFESARAEALEIIEGWPRRAAGYVALAPLQEFAAGDPLIDAAEALANSALDAAEAADLWFALGKMRDDAGRHGEAYRAFAQGNRLRPGAYDRCECERRVEEILAAYKGEMLAARASYGYVSRKPVFVIGMPRSGTSLLESLLLAHPEIASIGEGSHLNVIAGSLRAFTLAEGDLSTTLQAMTREAYELLGYRYVHAHARRIRNDAKTRIIDKLPHNFMNVGLAALILPEARFIHVRRAPMATGWSIWTQSFSSLHPYATRLEDIAHQYALHEKLMAHWKTVLCERIIEVAYENVVAAPAAETERILKWLGLSTGAVSLDDRGGRVVGTASVWQVRQSIHARSVERWKAYADEVQPLAEAYRGFGVELD